MFKNTSVFGITKIRNESKIIKDTLDHFSQFCDEIYVYDDMSEDNTLDIVKSHPSVKGVIENRKWQKDRFKAEYESRQKVLEMAKLKNPEWLLYFDADERIEIDNIDLTLCDGVRMKLFDFYITEEDKDKNYTERKYIGPEYREILMMYRNLPDIKYEFLDQREMILPKTAKIINTGYVKHYGKAISVQEWEKTCDYYSQWAEPYKTKWTNRKGKAVHTKSDFGADLIEWGEKDLCGYPI